MEAASNLLLEGLSKFSRPSSSSTFAIDTIGEDPIKQLESPLLRFVKPASLGKKHKDDRPILGFQDHEKVDEIPNATFLLINIAIIANHYVLRILIYDQSFTI